MQFDRTKLKDAIVYIADKCRGDDLGAVKLHKVLYFSDMLHYAATGRPITGSIYKKRPHGPTCEPLPMALDEMRAEGTIRVQEREYYGYLKKEYLPLVSADTSRFRPGELAVIDDMIDFVCRKNSARTISEFSHNRAWEIAEYGDVIPYSSVLHFFPTDVSAEAIGWASSETAKGETARSVQDPLGTVTYGDFRARVLDKRRTS